MQPRENGRYCGSCQKVVVDFKNMSDEEILDYFQNNAGKRICGTFRKSQINSAKPPKRDGRIIKFLAALLLVFGASLFSCNPGAEKPSGPLPVDTSASSDQLIGDISPPASTDTTKTPKSLTQSLRFIPPKIEEEEVTEEITTGEPAIEPPEQAGQPVLALIAETMPEFPGGQGAMMKYIQQNLRYPEGDEDFVGTVYVSFIVRKTGKIDDVKILRGCQNPKYEAEIIRVVKAMPDWTPGEDKGQKVDVRFNLPVRIELR